jgi:chromosome partitioning protein
MKVLASYSIKGGVGKTTAAVNVAALAAEEGRRVLLWDLDPQGGATYLLRVRAKVKGGGRGLVRQRLRLVDAVKASDIANLDLLPSDFSYRHLDLVLDGQRKPTRTIGQLLAGLSPDYDVVILDCPPSASLVTENVVRAADLLLVPLLPAPLSVRTMDQLLDSVLTTSKGNPPAVLAFLSMVDRRRSLHRRLVNELPRERQDLVDVVIPVASAVEQMSVRREPLVTSSPANPVSQAFAQLWQAVIRRW